MSGGWQVEAGLLCLLPGAQSPMTAQARGGGATSSLGRHEPAVGRPTVSGLPCLTRLPEGWVERSVSGGRRARRAVGGPASPFFFFCFFFFFSLPPLSFPGLKLEPAKRVEMRAGSRSLWPAAECRPPGAGEPAVFSPRCPEPDDGTGARRWCHLLSRPARASRGASHGVRPALPYPVAGGLGGKVCERWSKGEACRGGARLALFFFLFFFFFLPPPPFFPRP